MNFFLRGLDGSGGGGIICLCGISNVSNTMVVDRRQSLIHLSDLLLVRVAKA